MTREEAIKILRTRIVPIKNWQETHEAINMAIEALQDRMKGGDDQISRQDAIEACLAKAKRQHGVLYSEDIDNIIDSLPSASVEVGEWIPCSERLPEEGEVVLITNKKGNVKHGQYRGCYPSDKVDRWWWKKKTTEEVIAWMPLPKPYEPQESEGKG